MKKQFTELIGVFSALVFLTLLTSSNAYSQYCNGSASSEADEYIFGITYGAFTNNTGGADGTGNGINVANQVTDFTDLGSIGEIGAGIPSSLTVEIGSPFLSDDVYVYADLNQDGEFTQDEEIGRNTDDTDTSIDPSTKVVDLNVPLTATAGETQFRVKMVFAGGEAEQVCDTYTWGETEDYRIVITNDELCSPPSIDYDVVENCETNTYDIEGTINSYGVTDAGTPVFTLDVLRESDNPDFELENIVLPPGLVGQTVALAENVPFGTSVTLTPAVGFESVCNISTVLTNENICPPPNDECSEALVAECGVEYSGNTQNAAALPQGLIDLGSCGTTINGGGVYYEFTAPFNVIVTANTFGSGFDTKLFAFTTDDCEAFSCVAGNDDSGSLQSQISFNLNAGESVLFFVSGFFGASGDYNFIVNCEELLCTSPTLAFEAQDLEGNPLGDCQEIGEQYQLAILLSDVPEDDPNLDYTVSAGGLSEDAAVIDQEIVLGPFDAGTNVTIDVEGNQDDNCGAEADYVSVVCPPENDECADALPLVCGDTFDGTTVGAVNWPDVNPDQPFCDTFQPSTTNGGVWYELTIDEFSVVDIDLSGSLYDTKLWLYSGACDDLTCIEGDDDGGTGLDSRITRNLESGTYYVFVSGIGTARGIFTGVVNCTPILCENPTVELTNVDDEGAPIDAECLEIGQTFNVLVELTGAEGNASYTVNVNGEEATFVDGDSDTYGPFNAGTVVTVNAEGDDDSNCGFVGEAGIPVCPPDNDTPCTAEVIECGGVYLGTNLGASTSAESGNFCDGSSASGMVFYQFSNPSDGEVVFRWNTCNPGTSFDTDSHLFDGPCEDLACRPVTGQTTAGGYVDGQLNPATGGSASTCDAGSSVWATGGEVVLGAGETVFLGIDGFGTAQGIFELLVTCQNLECSPTVTAEAVQDNQGTPLDGCIDFGGSYWVSLSLEGGSGNDLYTASASGVESVEIAAGGSGFIGPFPVGTNANINVAGNTDNTCGGSTAVDSPDVCPPSNDLPCDAIPIVADGSTGLYTSLNATSDEGEPILAFFGGTTVWFSVVAPESGRINVSTCGDDTEFDTTLGLFEVEECGDYTTYTQVAFNDDNFAACGTFGQSELEACVTPGQTYFIQVDGFFGSSGTFALTASEEDGAICDCVLPDLGPDVFTFAETFPICNDEGESFGLTFFGPTDIGSQAGMFYTYDWPGNPNPEPISLLVGANEEVTVPETFTLGVAVDVTVTIDEECVDADGSIYPLSGSILQDEFACEPDCEGTPGGTADPGTACTTDNEEPGIFNDDCECIPTPPNDLPCNAEVLECGVQTSGSNVAASISDNFCSFGARASGGVWYEYTAEGNGTATIATCLEGTDFDTDSQVFTGTCDDLVCYDEYGGAGYVDGDSGCPFEAWATGGSFPIEEGVTYYILIDGFGTASGNFELLLTCELDPDGATIDGSVEWNSDCGDTPGTVDIYEAGTNNLLNSYEVTVDAQGAFSTVITETGTVDVYVKVEGYLADVVAGVELVDGSNVVSLGAPTPGDMTGNNEVGIGDFSQFSATYGLMMGDVGFNGLADYNCNMEVDIPDFSSFSANYGFAGAAPEE